MARGRDGIEFMRVKVQMLKYVHTVENRENGTNILHNCYIVKLFGGYIYKKKR